MKIRLFGTTTVSCGRTSVPASALGGPKPRQVLEILAVSVGTPVSKGRLAELLWEGRPPRSYLGTLESYVCVLRRALETRCGPGSGAGVATVPNGYILLADLVAVDLAEFRSAVRAADAGAGSRSARLSDLESAVLGVEDELLASAGSRSWALAERDIFRGELGRAAGRAASGALDLGRPECAVRLAGIAIDQNRFAEDAWRILMSALWNVGRRPEALQSFAALRGLLGEELGTEPSRETADLYLSILRGSAQGQEGSGGSMRNRAEGQEEVRALMGLLRQLLSSIPGLEVPQRDRALVRAAHRLETAS